MIWSGRIDKIYRLILDSHEPIQAFTTLRTRRYIPSINRKKITQPHGLTTQQICFFIMKLDLQLVKSLGPMLFPVGNAARFPHDRSRIFRWNLLSLSCLLHKRPDVWLTACEQAVRKPVWHIPSLCVQWKTPDDGQRNCPKYVEFYSKNKFEKLVHLVGFIIRIREKELPALFKGRIANPTPANTLLPSVVTVCRENFKLPYTQSIFPSFAYKHQRY